ncbi:MAG TPA: thioredoxin fold domain-containing protein, partial [Ramlibacter sp.]|nr:thioredoxin fold domain-containing protein [Ramlibacter sp.]
ALVAGALLSACDNSAGPSAGDQAGAKAPVTVAAIQAEAKGFTVGAPMAARTVYVFFDPQCPHCAALWQSAKPLKSQAKFIWIPVGLIGKTSIAQGATILAAKDPIAAMEENEGSILNKQGGISASGDIDPQKPAVEKNTALLNRFGFAAVPTIVALNAQTGALVTNEGSLPTAELARLLGLQVPASQ